MIQLLKIVHHLESNKIHPLADLQMFGSGVQAIGKIPSAWERKGKPRDTTDLGMEPG